MKIYRTKRGIIVSHNNQWFPAPEVDWDTFVNRANLFSEILNDIKSLPADKSLGDDLNENILAPVGDQEVWASGVTYMRSREARMEESKDAGGGDFYAKVYEAERPELFFKSPAYR